MEGEEDYTLLPLGYKLRFVGTRKGENGEIIFDYSLMPPSIEVFEVTVHTKDCEVIDPDEVL